jgi:putative FmdB family regulatory protein
VPLYDYDCAACGRRFEVIRGIDDPSPERCPLCGEGPVRKAFAPPTIHFKGSGWAKKERHAAAKSRSSSSDAGDTAEKGDKAGETSKPADGGPSAKTEGGSTSTSTTPSPTTSTSTTSSPSD